MSRVERPEAVVLAIGMAAVAAIGWYGSIFVLAVAVGVQLVAGGLGAVWIIGPATARLGFARYATLATAGVALTLFGRVTVDSIGILLVPVAALALWGIVRLELELERTGRGGLPLELGMVVVAFTAADGAVAVVPPDAWPAALAMILLLVTVPAIRLSEARGRYGVEAVGESLIHLLAIAQVAAAVRLLGVPLHAGAALVALAFHAWGLAAEALERNASARSVALEFGALALLGIVVALLLGGR